MEAPSWGFFLVASSNHDRKSEAIPI